MEMGRLERSWLARQKGDLAGVMEMMTNDVVCVGGGSWLTRLGGHKVT